MAKWDSNQWTRTNIHSMRIRVSLSVCVSWVCVCVWAWVRCEKTSVLWLVASHTLWRRIRVALAFCGNRNQIEPETRFDSIHSGFNWYFLCMHSMKFTLWDFTTQHSTNVIHRDIRCEWGVNTHVCCMRLKWTRTANCELCDWLEIDKVLRGLFFNISYSS